MAHQQDPASKKGGVREREIEVGGIDLEPLLMGRGVTVYSH